MTLARIVRRLTWLNLAAVVVLLVLICGVSERWWLSRLLTYLPRQPYALPALLLLPMSLAVCRSVAWVNVLALLLAAGPVMGVTVPVPSPPAAPAGRTVLRIASGNIEEGKGSLRKLMLEIDRFDPNVIVLQEASGDFPELHEKYADWEVVHLQSFFIASRFPMRVVEHCRARPFDRWTALLVEIDTPDGPIQLCDVHLMTPRHGAGGLGVLSPLTGAGVDEFNWHQRLREDEQAETRAFLEQHRDRPLLVIGDFNTPSTSSLFQQHWSGFQVAFEAAGWGYGYTSPCNASRKWIANTPWMRIDHVLADADWRVHSCRIGLTDGSDHRLMFTELSVRARSGGVAAREASPPARE